MITLTDSTARAKHWYISSAESCCSSSARSHLFTCSAGTTRSLMAWRSTVSVCTHTPSIVSTTTSAPSVMRSAAVTSDEKSTWPGESIRLMRYDLFESREGADSPSPSSPSAAAGAGAAAPSSAFSASRAAERASAL